MTHVPEIGAENSYQKNGTKNRHEIKHLLFITRNWYQKNLVPNSNQMGQKLVPVFRYWFLVLIYG